MRTEEEIKTIDSEAETEMGTEAEAETPKEDGTVVSPRRVFRLVRRVVALLVALVTVAGGGVLYALKAGDRSALTAETAERSRTFLYGDIVDTSEADYTYEEMKEDLFLLAERYPSLLRVSSAGQSADGREIYYADLGPEHAERQIFVSAGIHGREYLTPLLAMKLTEYYLLNYETEHEDGVAFSDVAGNCSIRIVPMINPDGITISQKGIDGIQSEFLRETVRQIYQSDYTKYESYRTYGSLEEYLKYWKANARGVDLNRNFGIDYWAEMKTGIGQPSSQAYKGVSANSEPETRAVMGLIESLTNPICVLSLHSQGEIIYWDCGQTGAVRQKTQRLTELAARVTGYGAQTEYSHPDATLDDWCVLEKGIPAVNLETGKGRCPLPIDQFETIWNDHCELWFYVARDMR